MPDSAHSRDLNKPIYIPLYIPLPVWFTIGRFNCIHPLSLPPPLLPPALCEATTIFLDELLQREAAHAAARTI